MIKALRLIFPVVTIGLFGTSYFPSLLMEPVSAQNRGALQKTVVEVKADLIKVLRNKVKAIGEFPVHYPQHRFVSAPRLEGYIAALDGLLNAVDPERSAIGLHTTLEALKKPLSPLHLEPWDFEQRVSLDLMGVDVYSKNLGEAEGLEALVRRLNVQLVQILDKTRGRSLVETSRAEVEQYRHSGFLVQLVRFFVAIIGGGFDAEPPMTDRICGLQGSYCRLYSKLVGDILGAFWPLAPAEVSALTLEGVEGEMWDAALSAAKRVVTNHLPSCPQVIAQLEGRG